MHNYKKEGKTIPAKLIKKGVLITVTHNIQNGNENN